MKQYVISVTEVDKMKKMDLANAVSAARILRGFSQSELAALCGVSRNTISSIECGLFSPTAKLAARLCIVLNFSFEELFWLVEA